MSQQFQIVIHVTEMKDCQSQLYVYRQIDDDTQYKTFVFTGSTDKCPKYYCFNKRKNAGCPVLLIKKKKLQYVQGCVDNVQTKLITFQINKQNQNIILTVLKQYQHQIPSYHVVRFWEDGFILSLDDRIKMGYNFLNVRSILGQQNKNKSNNQIIQTVPRFKQQNKQEQRICRVCYSNQQNLENQTQDYLINPCSCEEPIHISCLRTWMKFRCQRKINPNVQIQEQIESRVSILNNQKTKCQICKQELPSIFKVEQTEYGFQYQKFDIQFVKQEKDKPIQIVGLQNLSKHSLGIGRNQTNQLCILEPSMSRNHCQIDKSVYDQIIISDNFKQVPLYGTLVKVNQKNNKIILRPSARRGFQIQQFLVVLQLKRKER